MSLTAHTASDPLRCSSPEFRLVLLCLRWPYDEPRLLDIAAAAQHVRDWVQVRRIAERHRVLGLVHMGLSEAAVTPPSDVDAALQKTASDQTRFGFLMAIETARLGKQFAAAAIPFVLLKGAALTQAIYGNTSLRYSKDIDVLVEPGQVAAAVQVLLRAGFTPLQPLSAEPQHIHTWIRYGKAMDFVASATGVLLELHWRLTDLPLLRSADPRASLQTVYLAGGTAVQTLSDDLLIAYLCVHGAAHGWGRLKWLADVYALLPQDNPRAVEALYERTRHLDAGRTVAQGILLCRDLFGLQVGRVAHAGEDDAVVQFLVRSVLRRYRRGNEATEVYEQPFGTTSVYLSRFFLGSGGDALLSEARTWTHRPEEVARWELPRGLLFLLPLKRLGQWLSERVRHRGLSSRP